MSGLANKSVIKQAPICAAFNLGFEREPNFVAHAGGLEAAAVYLDKFRDRHNTKIIGNWHPYNRIDPNQPQTRIPFLAGNEGGVCTEDDDDWDYGYDAEYGMGGDACIHNMARYVAVAPRNASTGVRHLDFGTYSQN